MESFTEVFKEIQDFAAPKLDGIEQMLYHYLFRHTRLEGKETITIGSRTIVENIGRARSGAEKLSRNGIPRKLKSLAASGLIEIIDKSYKGTHIKVYLPSEVENFISKPEEEKIELEAVDFYKRENWKYIFERDNKCSYCMKKLNSNNRTIDHIRPQSEQIDNSYRNLVAACFECNSSKNSINWQDKLRSNLREELITKKEFTILSDRVKKTLAGERVPTFEEKSSSLKP